MPKDNNPPTPTNSTDNLTQEQIQGSRAPNPDPGSRSPNPDPGSRQGSAPPGAATTQPEISQAATHGVDEVPAPKPGEPGHPDFDAGLADAPQDKEKNPNPGAEMRKARQGKEMGEMRQEHKQTSGPTSHSNR